MREKKSITATGIDVSKSKLDVACILEDESIEHFVIENSNTGIKKIMEKLGKYEGKIIMESTGRYHLLAAWMLSNKGYDVRVINPLLARKYLTASIRNNKTDKADSKILAKMGILEADLPKRFSLTKEDIIIRQKMGLLASLGKQIQNFEAVLSNYQYFQETLEINTSATEQEVINMLKNLKKLKDRLEKEIENTILETKDAEGKEEKILTSIPGVSRLVAASIIQFFDQDVGNPKKWIAYIGIDIASRQSGTWQGKGHLSKRGNSYLRKRIFGSAWGAVMNHNQFKAYYYDLKERGLKHVEAMLVISRKILKIAFTLLKKNLLFNANICFAS